MRERLTIRCNPELVWKLHKFCRAWGVGQSAVVATAIAKFLSEREPAREEPAPSAPEPPESAPVEEVDHEPK